MIEADETIRKLQNTIIRQKREESNLQKEIAIKYGTDEEILQKIENMNSLKANNSALQKKADALTSEGEELRRFAESAGGANSEV